MRTASRLTAAVLLAVLGAFVATAADPPPPPPLVKPITAPPGTPRVRFSAPGKVGSFSYKAQITNPKKKGETNDIMLHIGVGSYVSSVSIQQWKAWGFEVPMDRVGLLPELIIPCAQISPKPSKGRDVEFRVTNLKIHLYEAPGGEKGGLSSYLGVGISTLTGGADRACESRIHFADKFVELTAPPRSVKALNTGDVTSPDPQVTVDKDLKAAFIPLNVTGFPFASVNGQTQYKRTTGKVEQVTAGLNNGGGGITMSVSMARGCGVELDKEAGPTSGKVKELRLGPITGPGVTGSKDFVLRDVTVRISNNEDSSYILVGSTFVDTYFKDGVYACGSDGVWRLHGRVKPEHIDDIKTRIVPKKQ